MHEAHGLGCGVCMGHSCGFCLSVSTVAVFVHNFAPVTGAVREHFSVLFSSTFLVRVSAY
jgi:hypothetical protein